MTPERWQRVKQVFGAAMERPPGERGSFLEDACRDDGTLRADVEALLESHDEAGGFLETPAQATGDTAILLPGTRVGPFEITGLIGAGGMGEVYRARDDRLGRDVALKVLPRGLAWSADRLGRFEQEARAASALAHPHIVTVYDVGRHEGLPYLVMELLEGQTLAERIAQGPVPLRRALEWAGQAARGLAAAHERGIVHRDLKPANLFVTTDGRLKILDFGIAKLAAVHQGAGSAGAKAPRTTPGIPMGTVGYMSPEQARGEALDFRSDQFSLGCVLYEILAGGPPFERPTAAQTLAAVIEDEPAPVASRNPRVPPPVAWAVERCLAKEPADRYAATHDLARDLELALGRLSLTGPATPPPHHRPRGRAALGAVTVAVAIAAVAAWRLWPKVTPAAPPPLIRYLTYSGHDAAPSASPDGRTVAFSSSRDGRRRIWVMQVASGAEVPLTGGEDDHPRFSPDGSEILFVRTEGSRVSVYRVPSLGGEPRRLADDALSGDYSPDGRRIALVRQVDGADGMTSVVITINADGSDLRELARLTGRVLGSPRWSPDGATIALAETSIQPAPRTSMVLVDVATGTPRTLTSGGKRSPDGLAWIDAGRVAYPQSEVELGTYRSTSSQIVVQDIRGTETQTVLSVPLDTRVLAIVGPRRLVFGARSFRANLREVPLRAGAPPRSRPHWLTRGNSTDRQPVYDPRGEWVVFSSNRGGNLDLWAVSRGTGAVRRLTDDAAEDWDPAFTRDGRLLWSNNRTGAFEVWTANGDGSGARQVTRDGFDAQNPVATPDGDWIIYASANPRSRGITRIRPDGSENAVLIPGNVSLPEVSPDGRYVAFVADLGAKRSALRVARLADGALLPFEVPLPPWIPEDSFDLGRCRWLADGKSIAFISRDAEGTYGVYMQDIGPGGRASGPRRLAAFEDDLAAESFGISPDGKSLTIAYWDQVSNLMLATGVPGIDRPPASRTP